MQEPTHRLAPEHSCGVYLARSAADIQGLFTCLAFSVSLLVLSGQHPDAFDHRLAAIHLSRCLPDGSAAIPDFGSSSKASMVRLTGRT